MTEAISSERPLLTLEQVSVSFGPQRVLHAIDLNIRKGQTVVVIGESGCGKTVLLKLLIGLLRATVGRATFDGQVLVDLSDGRLTAQRLRFGYVFQNAALFDSMSVRENVAFGPRNRGGKSEQELNEIVHQRLREVGLNPEVVIEKRPAELSGGMRKRVALARALALDPEVMLYDEPTTGLDPIMTDVINELILQTRLRRPGVTSLVVTHEMRTVTRVADRVVMFYPLARLQAGQHQMIFDGTPDELAACDDPRVRQFVEGQAGGRITELNEANNTNGVSP